MKLAIMQPYFMPYIGYFQLINAVDKFVFLDDVTFIKQGWINRNRILLNDKEHLFSVPIKDISSNK
ncbi:WbqC family protein, partial [bacterium]|nr:WbqC family protein [bacterium]